jgi:hypothetical protein
MVLGGDEQYRRTLAPMVWTRIHDKMQTGALIKMLKEDPDKFNWYGQVSPSKNGIKKLRAKMLNTGYSWWEHKMCPLTIQEQDHKDKIVELTRKWCRKTWTDRFENAEDNMVAPLIMMPTKNMGFGVFTMMSCKKGEALCCYPIHYYAHTDGDMTAPDVSRITTRAEQEQYWGFAENNQEAEADEFIEGLTQNNPNLHADAIAKIKDYAVEMASGIITYADPTRKVGSRFYGHFFNDLGFKVGQTPDQYDETLNNTYWDFSGVANDGTGDDVCPIVCRASRDIKQGEQLGVPYGSAYWWGSPENHDIKHRDEEHRGWCRAKLIENGLSYGAEYNGHAVWRPYHTKASHIEYLNSYEHILQGLRLGDELLAEQN